MATIQDIMDITNEAITDKTDPDSIQPADVGGRINAVTEELGNRGVIIGEDTSELSGISPFDTSIVLIKGVGLFTKLETADPPDDVNTFASSESGFLWQKLSAGSPADPRLFFSRVPNGGEVSGDGTFIKSPTMFIPVPKHSTVAFEMHLLFAGGSSDYNVNTKFETEGLAGLYNNIIMEYTSPFDASLGRLRRSDINASGDYTQEAIWDTDVSNFASSDGQTLEMRGVLQNISEFDEVLSLYHKTWIGYSGFQMRLTYGYVKCFIVGDDGI